MTDKPISTRFPDATDRVLSIRPTDKPKSTKPVDMTDKPKSTKPVDMTDKPKSTKPVDMTDKPKSTKPVDMTDKPKSTTDKPDSFKLSGITNKEIRNNKTTEVASKEIIPIKKKDKDSKLSTATKILLITGAVGLIGGGGYAYYVYNLK
jgi:hypothetical protein